VARLVIVDDHPIVREGLKAYLELQGDLEVVAEAGSVREALERIATHDPDLVLLDLQLPDASGLKVLADLANVSKCPKVLVLTSFLDEDYLREALRAGAAGYVVKHAGPAKLVDSVRAALRGELPLDPGAVKLLAQERDDPLDALTPREREVLALLAEGKSNKRIARELDIVEKTVKSHVSSILAKLGCKDRLQAALYLQRRRRQVG
jgi:DNA-binding NarL/FixJ family response regulator